MSETASGERTGGCRCGRLRFAIRGPELLTMACHCTGCQRMTGSAFSLSIAVPAAAFAVTAGEPVVGGLHGEVQHMHCPHCLSWVFTRMPVYPMVNLRATMLDEARGFVPYVETCTDEMLPWAKTPAVHSFAVFPSDARWPELIAEYMKTSG